MRNVLVSGGAGFTGSHVAQLLQKRGCKVRILDNFVGGRQTLQYFDESIEVFSRCYLFSSRIICLQE